MWVVTAARGRRRAALKMTGGRGAVTRRMLPSVALFIAVLFVAALWIGGAHGVYFALLRWLGVPAYRFPFLDTLSVLTAIDCQRRGIDVYLSNPCDVLGLHAYTPLWFRLGALPIDASWTPCIGLALALAFAASLVLLPAGRDLRAAGVIGAAALSPAVAFALERGNTDLLMFVLAALAGWIALRRLPVRLAAFPIILLAAALKVYPATLLILALRERLALCLAVAVICLAALLAYAAIDAVGLREMLAVVPGGSPFIYSFGAGNLPSGLGVVGWPPVVLTVVRTALFGAMAVFVAVWLHPLRAAVRVLTPAEATALLIGAALILGCFVAGQSGEYRAVLLLFTLPALTALSRISGPTCRGARWTVWVILLQLWGDLASAPLSSYQAASGGSAAGAVLLLWQARELAWWWTAAVLLALMLAVLDLTSTVTSLRLIVGPRDEAPPSLGPT
jgi:hypothetical protein